MIIKKYTFQSGRVDYIIFDYKNIHINKRRYWNSIDAFCIYDIMIISFYPNSPANEHSLTSIWDVNRLELSRDSMLDYLNYYIKVEEESDEFREIANLYNTLI